MYSRTLALLGVLSLSACTLMTADPNAPRSSSAPATPAPSTVSAPPSPSSVSSSAPVLSVSAVFEPASLTPISDTTPAGAQALIQRYYDAVNRGDYQTAFDIWHGEQTMTDFKTGYAQTVRSAPEFGKPGDIGAAAGSIYLTLPVTLISTHTDGTVHHFVGSYVLRRVNNVDGATAEQLRWQVSAAHFEEK